MQEVITVILIFCGIMLMAAVVFGGWLIVAIARWVTRMIGSMVRGDGSSQPFALSGPAPHGVRCGQPKCRTVNPEQARFCRRCGRMIKAEGHAVRRVAMW